MSLILDRRSPATRPAPWTWRPTTLVERVATVLVLAAVALALDALTGGRWRMALIWVAGLGSLLAVLPRLDWLVVPVAAYGGTWISFNLLRAYADATPWADPVLGLVPALETALALGRLPSAAAQQAWYAGGGLAWHDYALTAVYMTFFVAPHLAAAVLLWRSRRLFWHYVGATAALFVLALVGFYALPTAPPWLVTEAVPEGGYDQILRVSAIVMSSLDLPVDLYHQGMRGSVAVSEVRIEPNPVAALPSIHFAATALLVFPAFAANRWLGWAAVVYAALMGAALVYLGEHYLLDLAVGGVFAAIGWIVAGRLLDDRTRRVLGTAGAGRRGPPPSHGNRDPGIRAPRD